MKKRSRGLLITALCCVVIGTTLTCAAMAAIRITGKGFEVNYNEQVYTEEFDSISAIQLNLVNEPVNIVRGGDHVTLTYSQRYDGQYRISGGKGGTLSLERDGISFGLVWTGFGPRFDVSLIENWIRRWGWSGEKEFDGSDLPITITIPEGMALNSIGINGVDIRVLLDHTGAKTVDINGVNAVVTVNCEDVELWCFETNGIGSSLSIEGKMQNSVGHSKYYSSRAESYVTVNGVNASLNVWVK